VTKKTELFIVPASSEFKQALRRAAAREDRSQSNLVEWLAREYCREHDLLDARRRGSPAAQDPGR